MKKTKSASAYTSMWLRRHKDLYEEKKLVVWSGRAYFFYIDIPYKNRNKVPKIVKWYINKYINRRRRQLKNRKKVENATPEETTHETLMN